MKPYIVGAICIWFLCGFAGAVLLGQQRVDIPTIAGARLLYGTALTSPSTTRPLE
jgi:hypothetical protein